MSFNNFESLLADGDSGFMSHNDFLVIVNIAYKTLQHHRNERDLGEISPSINTVLYAMCFFFLLSLVLFPLTVWYVFINLLYPYIKLEFDCYIANNRMTIYSDIKMCYKAPEIIAGSLLIILR